MRSGFSSALNLGVTIHVLIACAPDGALEGPSESRKEVACPVGHTGPARGLDSMTSDIDSQIRELDGAVLLAHWPAGAQPAGYTAALGQEYEAGGWVEALARAIDPCGAGAHQQLAVSDVGESGPPGDSARGRVVLLACGERADAPDSEAVLDDASEWPSSSCDEDQWLWLWTARTCADIRGRFPEAASGIYLIDPDGPGGDPPGEAFCDQRSIGGGWTQVLGVEHTGDREPPVLRPASLREGLATAARNEGYVPATTLGEWPQRDQTLSFRFYCRRDNGGVVHVFSAERSVGSYFTDAAALSPHAPGTFTRVDDSMEKDEGSFGNAFADASKLGSQAHLWGFDEPCGFCSAIGRWGETRADEDANDRIANHPMWIDQDADVGQARGYRAVSGVQECDGPDNGLPGSWRVFVR